MQKFRRKPNIVEAIQWEPGLEIEDADIRKSGFLKDAAFILTKSGQAIITKGDYLIKEPIGPGYYPCDKETFKATYEKVEE